MPVCQLLYRKGMPKRYYGEQLLRHRVTRRQMERLPVVVITTGYVEW
jgi:hypothetical protein